MAIRKQHSGSYAKKSPTDKLLLDAPLRDRLLCNIISETACTVSELVRIKEEDTGKTITIKNRKIPVNRELQRDLRKFLKDRKTAYVFTTRQSPHMNERRAQQILKKYRVKPSQARHDAIKALSSKKGADYAKKAAGLKHLRKTKALSKSQIEAVRKAISSDREKVIFELLLETGCRLNELVEIRVGDIGMKSLLVGKRKVELGGNLLKRLKSFANGRHGYLLESRQRTQISDKRVFQILKGISDAAGVELNPRLLRNTRIAFLLSKGKSELHRQLGIKADFARYGLMHE